LNWEGGNQFELVAEQSARQGLTAKNAAVDGQSPQGAAVVSAKVEPVLGGQVGEPVSLGYGPRIVTVNRVRISGEITGAKDALVIESNLAGQGTPLRIAPALDGKPAAFNSDDIELKPGKQMFLVRQRELGGPPVTTTIELDYRPPLPDLVIDRPQADQVLVAGRDQPSVEVAAKLQGLPPDQHFRQPCSSMASSATPRLSRSRDPHAFRPGSGQGRRNRIEIKTWDTWNEPRVAPPRWSVIALPSIDKVLGHQRADPSD
jgi:hypothetical protein